MPCQSSTLRFHFSPTSPQLPSSFAATLDAKKLGRVVGRLEHAVDDTLVPDAQQIRDEIIVGVVVGIDHQIRTGQFASQRRQLLVRIEPHESTGRRVTGRHARHLWQGVALL